MRKSVAEIKRTVILPVRSETDVRRERACAARGRNGHISGEYKVEDYKAVGGGASRPAGGADDRTFRRHPLFAVQPGHVGMLVLLLVIMLIFTRGYIKPGSFVCAFCGGWIIDLFLWVFSGKIGEGSPLWLRIVCMVAGCIILAFGMSVVIASRSGTGPNDLVAMILSDKVGSRIHLQFRWVRLICDAIFVGLGWLLGGVVGAGTLVAVFLTGPQEHHKHVFPHIWALEIVIAEGVPLHDRQVVRVDRIFVVEDHAGRTLHGIDRAHFPDLE